MHAPNSGIDVEQLKDRILSRVQVKKRRSGLGHTETGVPRLVLDRDKAFSDVLQFHLNGGRHPDSQKLEGLREQAREKTEVSRWIPKPFRRWFRKQGGFNKLVLESLKMVEKNQRDLLRENREVRAYLSAHYYWFRDFVERRIEDREMINALHARAGAHERSSHAIQIQIDRQAEALQSSGQFANSALEQLEVHVKQLQQLTLKAQAIEDQETELRRSLEEETYSRGALFAEVTAKLEQEMEARSRTLTELSAKIEHEIAANHTVSSAFAERHSEIAGKTAEVERRLSEEAWARTQLEAASASAAAAIDALQKTFQQFDERQVNESAYIKGELSLQQQLIHDRSAPADRTAARSAPKAASNEGGLGHRFDAFYLAFENRFRGSREEIKARFAYYLPHLAKLRATKNTIRVLDVGCGRGEWMELLKENHYSKVSGVDCNVAMAAQCRARDLDVVVQDGLEYLFSLEPASLNVITAFHLIEHLVFEDLMRFLSQCRRALKRGGMLIVETPNPDNLIVAAKNFYTDPTHVRPLPSVLTSFLAEHVGFSRVSIFSQHPFDPSVFVREQGELAARFNELFYSEQDYAIIARKP